MKDSEIVAVAKELIKDEDSWGRGLWCMVTPEGKTRHCAAGAVLTACGEKPSSWQTINNGGPGGPGQYGFFMHLDHHHASPDSYEQYRRVLYVLGEVADEMFRDDMPPLRKGSKYIPDYNDEGKISHEDVLAIFDKTEAKLAEQGL